MKIIKNLIVQSLILASSLIGFYSFAADQSICNPDAPVVLYNDGSVRSCQLQDNYNVGNSNITCKSGGRISFYENGTLESCVLYEGVSLSNTNCKPDNSITFYFDGNLRSCTKQD